MRIVFFSAWAMLLLSFYGWSTAYGYSPFGDGQNVSSGGRGGGAVFVGGYRSGPRHK